METNSNSSEGGFVAIVVLIVLGLFAVGVVLALAGPGVQVLDVLQSACAGC